MVCFSKYSATHHSVIVPEILMKCNDFFCDFPSIQDQSQVHQFYKSIEVSNTDKLTDIPIGCRNIIVALGFGPSRYTKHQFNIEKLQKSFWEIHSKDLTSLPLESKAESGFFPYMIQYFTMDRVREVITSESSIVFYLTSSCIDQKVESTNLASDSLGFLGLSHLWGGQ